MARTDPRIRLTIFGPRPIYAPFATVIHVFRAYFNTLSAADSFCPPHLQKETVP